MIGGIERSELDLDELRQEGWTRVRLLDDHGLEQARRVVDELQLADTHGFFASPANAWGDVARSVDRRLKEITAPAMAQLLGTHRVFMAGLTTKGACSEVVIPFHQDWTYTDERAHLPVFLWCSLVDCNSSNGGLMVVPGSNRWPRHLRPSRNREPAEEFQAELAGRAVPLDVRAGEAIAFDPATFHGSGPNTSSATRPAFTIAAVPAEARLIHFHQPDDGPLEGYVVDDEFFVTNPYRARPVSRAQFEPYGRSLTATDLATALAISRQH